MGGAGHWPAPVGDPPTGTGAAVPTYRPSSLVGDALPVPSGESPDGTGQWPVLPSQFLNTLLAIRRRALAAQHASRITHHAKPFPLGTRRAFP